MVVMVVRVYRGTGYVVGCGVRCVGWWSVRVTL